MIYDTKQFLDLLIEYKSDETKKARRNVSAVAFTILASAFLSVQINKLSVLGLSLSDSSPSAVIVVAFALLAYWTLMFLLSWRQDKEIQKERELLLSERVNPLIVRLAEMDKVIKEVGTNVYLDYGDVKSAVHAYQAQQVRTRSATTLGEVIRSMEIWVPIALSILAAAVLVVWFANAP